MNRRLATFLAVSFAVTWSAWGILVPLARARTLVYGQWPFMVLYMLGGLGPTIGAYAAVVGTSAQAPLSEFHRRLLRWRVAGWWYLIAAGLPIALAVASRAVTALLTPDMSGALSVRPWYMFLPLFVVMIAGGGLEELGWRGVAQPEMERTTGRAAAGLLVGLVWAVWHGPLFLLPGVSQYEASFPVFAAGVIGTALILAWLYGRTGSILLCVVFHAAVNAIAALGFAIPRHCGWPALLGPGLNVLTGSILLLFGSALSNKSLQPTAAAPGR